MASCRWPKLPCTVTVAETQCVSFSDSIGGIDKNHAVEKSLNSLHVLPPDVVSDTAYTICWTGVVSPVV
jgi:hypothetical protein